MVCIQRKFFRVDRFGIGTRSMYRSSARSSRFRGWSVGVSRRALGGQPRRVRKHPRRMCPPSRCTDMASETEALLTARAGWRGIARWSRSSSGLCATAFALVASAGGDPRRAFARLGVSGPGFDPHVDGRTPTVFVAETEDPSRELVRAAQGNYPRHRGPPRLIGRLGPWRAPRGPPRASSRTRRRPESRGRVRTLVEVRRTTTRVRGCRRPLFTPDEVKDDCVVRRRRRPSPPGRVPADVRKPTRARRGDGRRRPVRVRTRDRILGGRRNLREREGGARRQDRRERAHLLAWTRATSRVDSSAWVLG